MQYNLGQKSQILNKWNTCSCSYTLLFIKHGFMKLFRRVIAPLEYLLNLYSARFMYLLDYDISNYNQVS